MQPKVWLAIFAIAFGIFAIPSLENAWAMPGPNRSFDPVVAQGGSQTIIISEGPAVSPKPHVGSLYVFEHTSPAT